MTSVFNGKLNILVNNVGTNVRKPAIEFAAEEYTKLMNTNLESTYIPSVPTCVSSFKSIRKGKHCVHFLFARCGRYRFWNHLCSK
ncbi:Tropinone reductase-like [Quillaja saponaria]|uniref:Tropinone reductase-like n=1 Tax=Quillaja saponaria TaxID=32244 RepID=A0AAD7PRU6_QUISA|nr:Tropinone reductase-like [Quillaja saponaria]